MIITVLGMVAQMERRFIKERQKDGIERAKAGGVYKGGTQRVDRAKIVALNGAGQKPSMIAEMVGCSRTQVYRVLANSGPMD
jgi:DNA invertase Pin-like site-specific DNA recombinase